MDARREYTLALTGLAGGGALALAVAQATWVVARRSDAGFDTSFAGRAIAGGLVACTLVAMAGAVAVLASRGLVRRAVGVLLAGVGAVVVWSAAAVLLGPAGAVRGPLAAVTGGASAAAPHVVSLAWWWCLLAVGGGLVVLAAGVVTALRGSRWPVMAARYDGPAGSRRKAAPDAVVAARPGRGPDARPGFATGRTRPATMSQPASRSDRPEGRTARCPAQRTTSTATPSPRGPP